MATSSTHIIVVPTYNTGPRLREVVAEILHYWRPVLIMVDGSTDDLIAGVARHTHFQASSSASNSRETGASWRDERYNSTERRTFGVLQYLRRTARDVDERLIARFIRDEVSPAITS